MPRARQRAQVVAETVLLLLCAALVVAFYGALIALIGAVWMTKNDVTVRIALTVFALAWFWPIVHALIWRRAWRKPWRAAKESAGDGESGRGRPGEREIDLTVLERERQATPESSPSQHLDAGHRGRAASV
ncbi:MAG: hypothetical protein JOZ99_15100 [Actinobacteria bacterium]|nr:hypothetical protein [Actinomycetota bacterium]